ncbi:hypothetical protein HDV04_006272 [Boothiomyces sp. JEL0838]|nr:hypothetical protein HDV04_006272 [Boothiomyces sp. JEL0838]
MQITNQLQQVKQDFLYNLELLKERDLDLAQLEKQLNSLENQNKELCQVIEKKEQEKQELNSKYLLIYKEKQDLKQEFWEIKNRIKIEFEEKINEKQNDFLKSKQEIEQRNSLLINELNIKFNELEKEKEELKFQMKIQQENHQLELIDLEKQYKETNIEINDEFKQMKLDYINIAKQKENIESRLLDASNTIKNLETCLRDTKWQYADERQIINEKILELQNTIEQERDYNDLERKEYVKERNNLLQDLNRTVREKKALSAQNLEYQREIQSQLLQISNHQIEIQELKKDFEKNILELGDTFEIEKQKLVAKYETEIDDLQSKMATIVNERSTKDLYLNQLKLTHSKELSSCKKEFSIMVDSQKQEIVELKSRLDATLNEKSKLESSFTELNHYTKQLETELEFKNSKVDNSTSKIEQMKIESKESEYGLVNENNELKSIIHQMRVDIEQMNYPRDHVRDKFNLLLNEYKKVVKEKSILLEENNRLKFLESKLAEKKTEDRNVKIKRKIRNYNDKD